MPIKSLKHDQWRAADMGMIQDTDLARDVAQSAQYFMHSFCAPQVMPMSSASVPCHVYEMK